jgi:hypothetical protein
MTSLQQAIRDRLDSLVSDLEDLVRQEALRLVSETLTNGTSFPSASSSRRGARGRGGGAGAPDALAARVLGYVQQHPGVRAEAVRAALGLSKPSWVKVSSALLAEKRLKKRGQRRGTSYSATG